jgi:hypothetical protein
MALEYDLTLLTDASPEQVAERAPPGSPRPRGSTC